MFVTMAVLDSCNNQLPTSEVGTLTAYYAIEDLDAGGHGFKKGQLICDSNNPRATIVDVDENTYKYESDYTGVIYSVQLPKSKVKKVVYTMNQLPVSLIGKRTTFQSEDGDTITIFKSDINGHDYYTYYDGKPWKNYEENLRHTMCYVLSKKVTNRDSVFYEDFPLYVKDGCLDLYKEIPAGENGDDVMAGCISKDWEAEEGWEGPAYDRDGKLLVDQYPYEVPEPYTSIAYIADQDALYYDGTLYYRGECEALDETRAKSEMAIKGYHLEGEELEYVLVVDVDGTSVKYKLDGLVVKILDEQDYDGDGSNECLIEEWLGGSSTPTTYSIFHVDPSKKEMERVDFNDDFSNEPLPECQEGKWNFVIYTGINKRTYVYSQGKLAMVEDKDLIKYKKVMSYNMLGVFHVMQIQQPEATAYESYDMDDDGTPEKLEFYSNGSNAFDWGLDMSLAVHFTDGRKAGVDVLSPTFDILSAKTNGVHDILRNDKHLYQWNGKEFVEKKFGPERKDE